MTDTSLLLARNKTFADNFTQGDMPALPKLGALILSCIDARADPAHILGLELGDAVVFRNNGGRVTPVFINEAAALAALVIKLSGASQAVFHIILMQHTHCGAQHFANPELLEALKARGVDVSANAITNHNSDLIEDINWLAAASVLPDTITVSAMLYDVETGLVREISPAKTLADLRAG